MAQTPVSSSVAFSTTTPTTIYTVPTGKTAVVKSVLGQSLVGGYPTVTLNKVSNGTVYPLALNVPTGYQTQTGSYYYLQGIPVLNLLNSPITLAAGESISISTSSQAYYKIAATINNSAYKISSIVYSNSQYVVTGLNTTTSAPLLLTSPDGVTWTQRTSGFSGIFSTLNCAANDGSTNWVVLSQTAGEVFVSTDNAVTWTRVTYSSAQKMNYIIYANSKWVAVGDGGVIISSTSPASSWAVTATTYTGNTFYTVNYVGTTWVIGSSLGLVTSTDNLSTFTTPQSVEGGGLKGSGGETLNAIVGITYRVSNSTYYIGTGKQTSSPTTGMLYSSTDLITWTKVALTGSAVSASSFTPNGFFQYGSQAMWANYSGYYSNQAYSSDWSTITNIGTYPNGTSASVYYTSIWPITTSSDDASYAFVIKSNDQSGGASEGWLHSSGPAQLSAQQQSSYTFDVTSVALYGACGQKNDNSYLIWTNGSFPYYNRIWTGLKGTSGSTSLSLVFNGYYTQSVGCVCASPSSTKYFISYGNDIYATPSYNNGNWVSVFDDSTYLAGSIAKPTGVYGTQWVAACTNYSTITIFITNTAYAFITTNNFQSAIWVKIAGFTPTPSGYMGNSGNIFFKYLNGKFVLTNVYGQVVYSTDGTTWSVIPFNVQNSTTKNSQNIYISDTGIFTSTTSPTLGDNWTLKNSTAYANYSVPNNITYVGGYYYLSNNSGGVSYSTDLVTWTNYTFNGTQINNQTFYSATSYLQFATNGTDLLIANSAISSSGRGYQIGKTSNLLNSLVVGYATAGIVEIS